MSLEILPSEALRQQSGKQEPKRECCGSNWVLLVLLQPAYQAHGAAYHKTVIWFLTEVGIPPPSAVKCDSVLKSGSLVYESGDADAALIEPRDLHPTHSNSEFLGDGSIR